MASTSTSTHTSTKVTPPEEERVKIYVSNQRGYIWDVRDLQTLRVNHHICGVLSGTLPQVVQQNVFLGIPLMLLPDEVVLLVRNNLAVLIDDRAAHHPPTIEQATQYDEQRQSAIHAQQKHIRQFEQEKKLKIAHLFKDKIEKKRLLKLEKNQLTETRANGKDEATSAETETGVWQLNVPDLEPSGRSKPPIASTSSAPKSDVDEDLSGVPYTIMIQGSSTDAPWHNPSSASYSTLEAAKEAGVWDYPTNQLQQSRSKIFEDLWSKGHFMGGGLRFGGDFLVYPGDTLRYHSHFTLTVLSSLDQNIMPLDLISYGRLATAVKKAHLLASWDEKEDKVEYFSLEWAAMG